MVMICAVFEALLADLMLHVETHVKEQMKLPGDTTENMIRYVEKQQNITIGDMTDTIAETAEKAGAPAAQRKKLREQLTEMFRSGVQGTAR